MSVNMIAASLRSLWDMVYFRLSIELHDKSIVGRHGKEMPEAPWPGTSLGSLAWPAAATLTTRRAVIQVRFLC